jgi:hypothetical protein
MTTKTKRRKKLNHPANKLKTETEIEQLDMKNGQKASN